MDRYTGKIIFILLFCSLPLISSAQKSLTPADLKRQMFDHNPKLRQLRIERNQAALDIKMARTKKIPTVDFGVSYNYLTNPIDAIVVPAGSDLYVDPVTGTEMLIPPEDITLFEGMENIYYRFDVTVTQALFTWGKINKGIDIYELLEAVSIKALEAKKIELDVTLDGLLASLKIIQVIRRDLTEEQKIAQRLIVLAKEANENGFMVYEDYLEVRIDVMEIDAALAEVVQQEADMLAKLKSICGFNEISADHLDLDDLQIDPKEIVLPHADSLMVLAEKNNRQLAMLDLGAQVAELQYEVTRAKRNLIPDLGLQMKYSYGGPRFPMIQKGWYGENRANTVWSVGITTGIFDGGRKKQQIQKAELETGHIKLRYQDAFLEIGRRIDNYLTAMELSRVRMKFYRLKMESSRQQADRKEIQYKRGNGRESSWIRAEMDFLTRRITLNKQIIDFYKNYYSLQAIIK